MSDIKIGIKANRKLRVVSGCRVMFDARSTKEAYEHRSDVNGVAEEAHWRKARAIERKAKERGEAAV